MLTLQFAVAILAGLASGSAIKRAAPIDGISGYATLNGGTTGGAGGATTTVTTLAALRSAVAGTSPKIVKISGIITGDGEVIDVGSRTTVLGVGANSGVTGGGFRIKNGKNVIIRNLRLSKSPAPTDLIGLQNATNVWIDHNTFTSDLDHGKDYYDGQCDITHGSDFVTVSWNVFTEHYKVSLVGHSDNNAVEDTGHLRVTYHHNYFLNVNSRLPSLRFGTGHVYNNYMKDVFNSGVDSRDGAQVLVESNVMDSVLLPIETKLNGGYAVQRSNLLINTTMDTDLVTGTLTTVPYAYAIDPTDTIAAGVAKSAGAGIVTF
ncbi:pectate lyase [Ceratobasidium sp. AG-Ba]|nr:pectate lyase [Ceratobasidium sp. AG-Ba]QRW11504.1 pectate lyase [Ceratobasidium sp. AG-Ba]